ncbi:hypothetical protein [Herbiconiux daphne]|uniref:Uncharacterized protein n=1 Tax=Herbiconiux daphne TaxID=2970914 RepID=A0ABT2HA82_9MICO|nr:hypothetical protein [Herbiconiux daphne]MCS5736808.1 hypothetical protein [Herbiconiux daphne]
MAALIFAQLAASTLAPHAQAIKASTSVAGTKFSLPVKDLGILADRLNRGNPLTYFTTGLNSTPLGGGSVKIEYNTYADT